MFDFVPFFCGCNNTRRQKLVLCEKNMTTNRKENVFLCFTNSFLLVTWKWVRVENKHKCRFEQKRKSEKSFRTVYSFVFFFFFRSLFSHNDEHKSRLHGRRMRKGMRCRKDVIDTVSIQWDAKQRTLIKNKCNCFLSVFFRVSRVLDTISHSQWTRDANERHRTNKKRIEKGHKELFTLALVLLLLLMLLVYCFVTNIQWQIKIQLDSCQDATHFSSIAIRLFRFQGERVRNRDTILVCFLFPFRYFCSGQKAVKLKTKNNVKADVLNRTIVRDISLSVEREARKHFNNAKQSKETTERRKSEKCQRICSGLSWCWRW